MKWICDYSVGNVSVPHMNRDCSLVRLLTMVQFSLLNHDMGRCPMSITEMDLAGWMMDDHGMRTVLGNGSSDLSSVGCHSVDM